MIKNHKHDSFEIISADFGRGVHAKVSIVKRKSDGKVIIWKRPVSDSSVHQRAFQKEIKRSKHWRKTGISKVKVCWHPDRHSLLKTYVKGKTLSQTLENDHKFFSKIDSQPVKALGKFLRLLVDSRRYIQNLSCENIVYDGKRWQVIDSSDVHNKESRSKIKRDYYRKFFKIWSDRLHSSEEINALKLFLKKYCR